MSAIRTSLFKMILVDHRFLMLRPDRLPGDTCCLIAPLPLPAPARPTTARGASVGWRALLRRVGNASCAAGPTKPALQRQSLPWPALSPGVFLWPERWLRVDAPLWLRLAVS